MIPAQPPELVEPLHVALVATVPHLPLILCNGSFMGTLKQVEAQTKGLTVIKDAVGNQSAANLLQRATSAGTQLNKQRLELVKPFQDQIDAINAAAKGPAGRLDAVKSSLKTSQTNFNNEQRRLAEEAERARQAELQRLEEIRLSEEKAAQQKAVQISEQIRKQNEAAAKLVEEARLAGLPVVVIAEEENFDEAPEPVAIVKTETERQIEAIRFAPVVAPIKASGVREVTALVPFVTDVAALPDIFVDRIPKIAAIRSTFCSGFKKGDAIPVLSGCRFEVQTSTQSTGKSAF